MAAEMLVLVCVCGPRGNDLGSCMEVLSSTRDAVATISTFVRNRVRSGPIAGFMALESLRKPAHDPTPVRAAVPTVAEPTTHASPAVDPDRLFVGTTFEVQPSTPSPKEPDEAPRSWVDVRSAPPNPFELFDCTAKGDAPERVESASKARVSAPSPPVHHTSHHRPDNRLLSESELPDFSDHRRDTYWNAFKAVSADAQARHGVMGANLDAFRHAEGDPTLAPLGYLLASKNEITVPELTDQQRVPQGNGPTVGSLFDGDNNLRLDKHDHQAIHGAATAMNNGRGTIQNKMLLTLASDGALRAAVADIRIAFSQLEGETARLQAAAAAITAHQASEESLELQSEIDSLKAEASDAKEVIDLVLGVVTTVVYAATGEAGDAINQLGIVAGTLLGHVNDKRINTVMSKLQQAQHRHKSAINAGLGADLRAARSGVMAANQQLVKVGGKLDTTLVGRRNAYNALAAAVHQELPCPERNRYKIAGMLSAIPLVETVIARAQVLGAISVPAYNEAAARGLGMAAHHGRPVAGAFLRACGELNFNRMTARLAQGEWGERLQALLQLKTQIGGLRPG